MPSANIAYINIKSSSSTSYLIIQRIMHKRILHMDADFLSVLPYFEEEFVLRLVSLCFPEKIGLW